MGSDDEALAILVVSGYTAEEWDGGRQERSQEVQVRELRPEITPPADDM
jgi:hypothetical protein